MYYRFCCCLVLVTLLFASAATADTLRHFWSEGFGDVASQVGTGVATDVSGNVIITGSLYGTADFGGGPLTSAGQNDVYVAKFDVNGHHLWSRQFGDADPQLGRSVAVDGSGNIIVAGSMQGSVDFGGGPLTSAGGYDIFVAKFDADGNHLWSQRFGDGSQEEGYSVAVDASGNVVVTGWFGGSVDFGGGMLTGAGLDDAFVAKFGPSGDHIWSHGFGDGTTQRGFDVATDASGNVIATGYFQGSVDFGGGLLASAGGKDIYVAKYDANGSHLWSQQFGDAVDQSGQGVVCDASGNVIVTGLFESAVDFGGGPLTNGGDVDAFAVKFGPNGDHLWSNGFGGASNQSGARVDTDALGNVVVVGNFAGSVDFGGGLLTSAGNSDIFVATFDSNGNHLWSDGFGDENAQAGMDVAADASGNIIATGFYTGTVDFGGGPLMSTGSGDVDMYLVKFSYSPLVASITDIGNDQGRTVRITFERSGRDVAGSTQPIVQYEAYRRIDPLPSSSVQEIANSEPHPGTLSAQSALLAGWDYVGAIPARGDHEYSMIAPTLADSTIAQGMHYSVFFIRAATAQPLVFYASAPDSGYSVDNLAPGVPTNFGAAYHVASVELDWDDAPEADFRFFRIYRGTDPAFVPSPENLIHETADSGWTDHVASSWIYRYKIASLDHSGNESEAVAPALVTSAAEDDVVPARTALLGAVPNPFNPATKVAFELDAAGPVRLTVYDTAGRLVATLLDGSRVAGRHEVIWDGRDAAGRMSAAGVYLYRFEAGDHTETKRMALVR